MKAGSEYRYVLCVYTLWHKLHRPASLCMSAEHVCLHQSGLNKHTSSPDYTLGFNHLLPCRPSGTQLNQRASRSILQNSPTYFLFLRFFPMLAFPTEICFCINRASTRKNAEFCLEMFGFRFDKILMISAEQSVTFVSNKKKSQKDVFHLDRGLS